MYFLLKKKIGDFLFTISSKKVNQWEQNFFGKKKKKVLIR